MSKNLQPPASSLNPVIRCAVYTRKSTSEGLDQAFNSLDAQRESCEAYIASQKELGWQVIPRRYDDGGFVDGHVGGVVAVHGRSSTYLRRVFSRQGSRPQRPPLCSR